MTNELVRYPTANEIESAWFRAGTRLIPAAMNIDEDAVARDLVPGERMVANFGLNNDVDAAEDIWPSGGDYTGFPTSSPEEFQVLSDDSNDTEGGDGARTVRVYYLDDNYVAFDANGNFLYVDVTMNGASAVDAGVSGMRVWRVAVMTSGGSNANVGTITVRWKSSTSVIFETIEPSRAISYSTNFTIPAGYTGYVTRYHVALEDQNNRAQVAWKYREFGSNTFRILRPHYLASGSSLSLELHGADTLLEKSDIILRCLAVNNSNAIITADWGLRVSQN